MADDFGQSAAPHFRQSETPRDATLHRLIALALPMIFPLFHYGGRVMVMALFGVLSAVGAEALWNALAKEPQTLDDLTAVEIGLTCALLMPARADYPLVIFTAAAAVLVGSMPFGGVWRTPFVPAAVGYCLSAVCFPAETFTYSRLHDYVKDPVYAFRSNDALEPALSQIAQLRQGENPYTHFGEFMLGEVVGPLGASSVVLLLMAGLWLYMSGNLAWQCAAGFSLTAAALSFAIPYHTGGWSLFVPYDLLGGSTFFCCVFMAGCPQYVPKQGAVRWLWGGACGALAVLIQHFGSTEAGGAFAVLLMTPFASAFDSGVWEWRRRKLSWRTFAGQCSAFRARYKSESDSEL